MGEVTNHIGNSINYNEEDEEQGDAESNTLNQPLVKANRTLSSTPLALVGTKVSHIESLDYEYVFLSFLPSFSSSGSVFFF